MGILYTIYLHINPTNGKKYVGKTKQDVEKRWRKGCGYWRNKEFYADIVEIGWENFIHLILYEELTEERARIVETELIYLWDSVEKGYNQSYGDGSKGIEHTEEWKKRNSKLHKGKVVSEETRGKMRSRKVICITTNKVFNSLREASRFYNIHCSHLSDCCNGKRNFCGKLANGVKLEWKYLSDYLIENDNQ